MKKKTKFKNGIASHSEERNFEKKIKCFFKIFTSILVIIFGGTIFLSSASATNENALNANTISKTRTEIAEIEVDGIVQHKKVQDAEILKVAANASVIEETKKVEQSKTSTTPTSKPKATEKTNTAAQTKTTEKAKTTEKTNATEEQKAAPQEKNTEKPKASIEEEAKTTAELKTVAQTKTTEKSSAANTNTTEKSKASETTATKQVASTTQKTSDKTKTAAQDKKAENPTNIAFVRKLQSELNKGNISGAISAFDSIPAEELANDKELSILKASLCYSAGRYDDAKKIAASLAKKYPGDLEILELNLMIAKASGNKADYKLYSNEILAIDPNNAELNIQVARDYAREKKYKQAMTSYKKALKNDPQNTEALFGCGQMSYYIGDIKDAKDYFLSILKIDPENAVALSYLGKIAVEGENYASAIKYAQQAIKYDEKNYDYHMDLGKYYQQMNLPDDAIKEWEIARDLDPTYFLAYAFLAGIYDERNNFKEALENYRKVIETNPKYYYAYESAAILEWHEGNWEAARKDFTLAYEVSGRTNWSYALMIAATHMKEKKMPKAKEWLQSVMKKMNRDSIEYQMLKFYHDNYTKAGASALTNKINKEDSTTKRGKLWFYMGLYYEITTGIDAAVDMYSKVTAMQAPMFFEFRLAEWSIGSIR